MSELRPTIVRFSPEMRRALAKRCALEDRTMAQVIRRAVLLYLEGVTDLTPEQQRAITERRRSHLDMAEQWYAEDQAHRLRSAK